MGETNRSNESSDRTTTRLLRNNFIFLGRTRYEASPKRQEYCFAFNTRFALQNGATVALLPLAV